MRIIVIGAGASGLCLAYKLQRSFENFSLKVFEKNSNISGTWFENRYPGCACDVPGHNYVWSWEQKKDWSAVYVGSKEIFKYFKDFAAKYNLGRYINVSHEVIEARWEEAEGLWNVRVKDHTTGSILEESCDILINASGILNNWKWPSIPGLQSFKGQILHSAHYDESIDLAGKTVGLIGNGSSGIQILPAIYPKVKSVTTFLRSPTWVAPIQGLDQHVYTKEELDDFANRPGHLLKQRKDIESTVNSIYPMFLNGSKMQETTKKRVGFQMRTRLAGQKLQEKLIPEWGFGCRRMTPGIMYLETLQKPKVEVIYGEIAEINEKAAVCDNGKEYEMDVLICATGFDTSFKPRFPIYGKNGKNLQDLWGSAAEAHSYMGVGAPEQPNYLHFLGPNCPIGSGPLVGAIEAQADYMLRWCDRWQTENIKSFTPKQAAINDFAARTDLFMRDTIWKAGCRSWYKHGTIDGRVSALWPGSSLHYFEAMQYLRADDFDVEYKGNRFDWLGNGFSQTELDQTCDWAYYIREVDDSPYLSKAKLRKVLTKSGTVVREPQPELDEDDPNWKAWC
ncbi:FAD/NAD(P)-binding domain-containing protein [Mytilinidion resinicola]|uniref:FAD/NAD(P)-binding domain-containing protein n=1 Tax=Mytilinidion resinicola TaxID=574789 RepID=A0A6A6XZ24_9PEZI|nr:FAD/NAD(P)-binding domain-containing protein [Mytilinidion resinicola]KAF2801811.1 FAD/NAD(P)-binding domain-containing protein [Mytilinidion resinicola]